MYMYYAFVHVHTYLYVCMYVCIYIYTYVYIYIYIYTNMSVFMYFIACVSVGQNMCHCQLYPNGPVRKADTFEAALLQAPEKHWFLKRRSAQWLAKDATGVVGFGAGLLEQTGPWLLLGTKKEVV